MADIVNFSDEESHLLLEGASNSVPEDASVSSPEDTSNPFAADMPIHLADQSYTAEDYVRGTMVPLGEELHGRIPEYQFAISQQQRPLYPNIGSLLRFGQRTLMKRRTHLQSNAPCCTARERMTLFQRVASIFWLRPFPFRRLI